LFLVVVAVVVLLLLGDLDMDMDTHIAVRRLQRPHPRFHLLCLHRVHQDWEIRKVSPRPVVVVVVVFHLRVLGWVHHGCQ
jgi:hypothetical protein